MKRNILLSATFATLLASAAFAAEPRLGEKLGMTLSDISTSLAADNYELTKFKKHKNKIELYAVREDTRHEVYVDAKTGKVTKVKKRARRGPWPLPGVGNNDIRAKLLAQGYEVTKYEREHGEIEVYANKDGEQWELKIDPRTGNILRVEKES